MDGGGPLLRGKSAGLRRERARPLIGPARAILKVSDPDGYSALEFCLMLCYSRKETSVQCAPCPVEGGVGQVLSLGDGGLQMDYSPMEQYYIWLASVEGMTPTRFYRLLTQFGDARQVWEDAAAAARLLPEKPASALLAARNQHRFYSLFNRIEGMDCQVITRLSDHYPALLTQIYDPPPLLYLRGALALGREKQIAVVGSRRASRDGRRAAQEIACGLAREGVCVVSGLARGVDTCAHVGALEGEGPTIAVLGCGVDVVYPPENGALLQRILETGGTVVSEYPPGTPPYASNFPARNRIISGLCPGVLMVEGRKNSGAMITVSQAAAEGRDVFALPGSIYAPMSEGPNQLLLDGAAPVVSHWDILEYYRWGQRGGVEKPAQAQPELDEDEKKLVEPLRIEEKSFDELANVTGFNSAKLNSLLTILELRGIIKKSPGRMYRA